MQPINSIRTPIDCDLSGVSLEDAVSTVWEAPICNLTVHPSQEVSAKKLLKFIGAASIEHPLTPIIHLVLDSTYKTFEWSFKAGDKIYWSPGVC